MKLSKSVFFCFIDRILSTRTLDFQIVQAEESACHVMSGSRSAHLCLLSHLPFGNSSTLAVCIKFIFLPELMALYSRAIFLEFFSFTDIDLAVWWQTSIIPIHLFRLLQTRLLPSNFGPPIHISEEKRKIVSSRPSDSINTVLCFLARLAFLVPNQTIGEPPPPLSWKLLYTISPHIAYLSKGA